jgi:hypothetical protein
MPTTSEHWLLFKCIDGEFTPLSKPFKTKEQGEKVRLKHSERERKTVGVIRQRLSLPSQDALWLT